MDKKSDSQIIVEIMAEAMRDLKAVVKYELDLSVSIRRRTTQIVRFGITGIVVLIFALFALIFVLRMDLNKMTKRMDEIASYVQQVDKNIVVIANSMNDVKQSLSHLDTHTKSLLKISDSIDKMSEDVIAINNNIIYINDNIFLLNDNINIISGNILQINYEINKLNGQFNLLGYDVNRISSPMQFFPFR
jgi:methyl-accepting chemotaxis protein